MYGPGDGGRDMGANGRGYDRDRDDRDGGRGNGIGSRERGGHQRERSGDRGGHDGDRGDARGGYQGRRDGDRGGHDGGRGDARGGYQGRRDGDRGGHDGGRGDARGGYQGRRDGDRGGYDGGRGDARGGFHGGRGGDRFDGGRSGRGGGRGGGGRGRGPSHMGQLPAVSALLGGPGFDDASLLEIVAPCMADRVREIDEVSIPSYDKYNKGFRYEGPTAGRKLKGHKVFANHFSIDTNLVPERFYHYHIHILKVLYDQNRQHAGYAEDSVKDEDLKTCVGVVTAAKEQNPQWFLPGTGVAYDGRSALFTTKPLQFTDVNEDGKACGVADVNRFRIKISIISDQIMTPGREVEAWYGAEASTLRPLEISLLGSARWDCVSDNPLWFLSGSNVYRADGEVYQLAPGYIALKGYNCGLKVSVAGLVAVIDTVVTSFIEGGPLIEVMARAGDFRSVDDMERACRNGDMPQHNLYKILDVVKGCKCKAMHLGHTKKIKGFGPAANSVKSEFEVDGKFNTVDEYFTRLALSNDPAHEKYKLALEKNRGRLRYPNLPCVNVGNNKKPILIPPELIWLDKGKPKQTDASTAQLIRYAAIRPDERFRNIMSTGSASIINKLRSEEGFGMAGISAKPLQLDATLLPAPKIQYLGGDVVDPELNGEWRMDSTRHKFISAPREVNVGEGILYAMVIITPFRGSRIREDDLQYKTEDFLKSLENEAMNLGVHLRRGGPLLKRNEDGIADVMNLLASKGVRIAFVVLEADCYAKVKLEADSIGFTTQCIKWKNVDRPPRGFHNNIMLKANTKLGGTNHTFVSKLPVHERVAAAKTVFQSPPASFSWVFDKPCMLVGIDLSHPEKGGKSRDQTSLAAVVGTVDRSVSQYVAHIRSQPQGAAMVESVGDAMFALLGSFKQRNQCLPAHIIIYRDGVSDGQLQQVIDVELPMIREAITLHGVVDADAVKITIVVCQKRHHTRVVYQDSTVPDGPYHNPCPGLTIDGSSGMNSITSATLHEFYINSHISIQGTARPCKYILVHDEIGFKISELELLSYWSCYTYCRCNRSVSFPTPAYYAHWAAKRGKAWLSGGGSMKDLERISNIWASPPGTNNEHGFGLGGSTFFI